MYVYTTVAYQGSAAYYEYWNSKWDHVAEW